MVRNHHEGPDWIPATVIEVIGPVTYLVETDRGQRWKDMQNSNPEVDSDTFETASEVSSSGTDPSMEDPADSSLPEEPRTGTPDSHHNPETPTEETSPPDTEPEQSSTLPRRYLPELGNLLIGMTQLHGFGTNHVMVI